MLLKGFCVINMSSEAEKMPHGKSLMPCASDILAAVIAHFRQTHNEFHFVGVNQQLRIYGFFKCLNVVAAICKIMWNEPYTTTNYKSQ